MKKIFMLMLTMLASIAWADDTVSVKSVAAQQRYPWNGLVDIVVTLEGVSADELNLIGCSFAATNSATGAAIPVTSIIQKGSDTGSGTTRTRRFVWDAAKDVGEIKIDDVTLTVGAKVLGVQLWENGPYWAESNVGAIVPEGYGYYFWWGDTVGYKRNASNNGWVSVKDGTSYSFSDCPTYCMEISSLRSAGYIDSTGNLVAAHDAATAHLGAPWRMPTDAEFAALISNCDMTWTTCGGVYGRLVTGRGAYVSKSIFLPAAGRGTNSDLYYPGSGGHYWSSTPHSNDSLYACQLYLNSSDFCRSSIFRYRGHPLRPVRELAQSAASGVVASCVETHLKLDFQTGVRVCSAEGEMITYSTDWVEGAGEGAVAVVSVNGEVISEQPGSGTVNWTPTRNGTYKLTHKVMVNGEQIGESLTASFSDGGLPEIIGVTAQQRYPWNGNVDISYTVENAGSEARELSVWAVDRTTGVTNVAETVTGDIAYTNGQHHLVWDMVADGLTLVSTNFVFGVSYVESPLYCVIDLLGVSDPVRVDLTPGTRTAAETEILTYSTAWVDGAGEGAVAVVSVNGEVVSAQSGSGMVEWTPTKNGTYEMTHKVMVGGEQVGETLTANFHVDHLPYITDVTARQRYPWNGLVDVVVTLEGCTVDEVSDIECFFAATNGATGAAIPVMSITRKGSDTGSGTIWTRRFVWDAAKDVGAVKIDDVALTVVDAKVDCVQLWENGPYWARCNVGATKPEEYGYYFWWGDTVGYKRNAAANGWISVRDGSEFSFSSGNCPTYGMNNSQLALAGYVDTTGNLVAAHDAATAHLGAPWRMPTASEIDALIGNCDTTWTTRNGVRGRLVKGRGAFASKSIFLPVAGYGYNSDLIIYHSFYRTYYGCYWSSTPTLDGFGDSACYLVFTSGSFYRNNNFDRYYGQTVRPLRNNIDEHTGVTVRLKLDCLEGTRTAAETEILTYSTAWVDGAGESAVAVVSVNGEIVSEQAGSGTVEWAPTRNGTYELTHKVMVGGEQVGETLTANFHVDHLLYITDVTARQRYPWNGLVDIVVTLEGPADEVSASTCTFAATNSATLAAVPVTSITQKGVDAGSGTTWTRRFLWNAASDVGGVKIDDLALTVDAKILGGVQLWENGPYWAECNVGATKPEGYGYYFWWGDTVGYERNASNNGWVSVKDGSGFSFGQGNCPTFHKNNALLQSEGYIDSTGNLVAAHDAATAHLGAPWRMPTDAEFAALIDNCDTMWTTRGGVYGRLVTGRGSYASKSIFLPAAGYGEDSRLEDAGSHGFCWPSTPHSDGSYGAWYLLFCSDYFNRFDYYLDCRYDGFSVRPLRGFAQSVASGMVTGGVETHLMLDCRTGERPCGEGAETLFYDAGWYEDAVCAQVYDGSTRIAEGVSGSAVWQPTTSSSHTLKLMAYDSGGACVGQESVTRSFTHIEVVTTKAKEPTCTEDGCTKGSYCSRCQAVLAISEVLPALGHIEVVTTKAVEPTCTEAGCTKGSYCSRCQAVLAISEVLPALGHVEVVTTKAKEPTCTEDGCTKGSYCSRCQAVLAISEVLPALGHIEVVTTKAVEPTCTEAGCTKGSYCSRCQAVLAISEVLPALGHIEVVTTKAKEPTCTEEGCTKGTHCGRCGVELLKSEVLPALGHVGVITKPAVEPTSGEAGSTAEITCSRCGLVLQEATVIPALGYIRNVTARQLWPHKKVEVCYTLADDIGEVAEEGAKLSLSCSGSGSASISARTVIGDTICTPGLCRVVWDMEADGVKVKAEDVKFTVCINSGFVTKTFYSPSLVFDKTSDVWGGTIVESPSQLYATSLAEHTTVAYGCYMWMEKGVTYYFKGCYDDFTAVKVNDEWIMSSPSECRESSGSFTPTTSGCYPVEFRVGNNGGPGGCTSSSYYGILWRTSVNTTWRKVGNTASETVFFASPAKISGISAGVPIDTSDAVCEGMSVGPTVALGYSPIDTREAAIQIDGKTVFSSTNSGAFVWQPRTKGSHTVKHVAGAYTWTRKVNVTSLVHEVPTPSPGRDPDPNMSLAATERRLESPAAANGAIGTKGSGTWTATASDAWITINVATRNVGLPVGYAVAENKGVEERIGYIYVNGHVYTITQPGVGATLETTSADFETDGGKGSVVVRADAQATWHAWSNVDWVSVETTAGQGEDTVTFVVAPYNAVTTRSGTLTIAGTTFTVKQTGRRMKLNAEELTKDYRAHDIPLTVEALASTTWGIALDAPWMSVLDGGTGKGGSSVTLAINENPSYLPRTATALIGTETFTLHQQGRPTEALSFAISPETTAADVRGANGIVSVLATPDLPWTATSQASWLTVMPGFSSGAGNGSMVYAVSPNPTMSNRTGTIRVAPLETTGLAGKTHTVSQPAAVASLSESAHTFAAKGDSFDVTVMVDDIVGWSISKNADWVSIVGGLSRTGPGKVTINVAENMSVSPRETTIRIAGHAFQIVQLGRAFELEYEEIGPQSPMAAYTEFSIEVIPDGDVSWKAVASNLDMIYIWSDDPNCKNMEDGSVIGTGSATLKYMLLEYVGTGEARTGWIQIGDKKVYVTQRSYDLWIDPCATNVTGNAGAGEVSVSATIGQVWEAIATEPWITVVSGASGKGSGTVLYTYTDNNAGVVRTGKIIIAGEAYTVTQAARQLAQVTVMGEGEGTWTGAGTYDKGTRVTLVASPSEGWRFVAWCDSQGETVGTNPTLTVVADRDMTLVAVFEFIPVYIVNGEAVREGTVKSFSAPDPVVLGGTTQLVCRGTSAYPEKGPSFSLKIMGDVRFEWDLWTTNYWVAVAQAEHGTVTARDGARALPGWVEAGNDVAVTATPETGYSLMRLTGVGANPATVTEPLTVGAIFGVFNDTIAEAADAPSLAFRTGGDSDWEPVIDPTAKVGYTSVRSGVARPEDETWVETVVSGEGTLAFNWKVDCERDDSGAAEWDRLSVFTNGVEAARLDGKTDWQRVTLPLTAERTTVRWSFYRDDYDEAGTACENAAWIDGVEVQK